MATWCRPSDVPYPSVWRRFEGKERFGVKRKYWVQDLTDEYVENAIKFLIEGFVKDEPLCQYLDFTNDEDSMSDLEIIYRQMLGQKLGLVCLTNDDNGKPKMVGFNCTGRSYKGEPKTECKTKKVRAFVDLEKNYVPGYMEQYDILNITHYLYAIGLYVAPEYRGEGIGLQILNAREDLARAVGIPASCTLFTAYVSQVLAEKAGFQNLVPVDYKITSDKDKVDNYDASLAKIVQTYRYMYKLYQ